MIRLLSIAYLLLAVLTYAQDPSLKVVVSKSTVTSTEAFQYQITADCKCDVDAPDFADFDVLDRSQSQFQGTTNINGQVTNSCSTSLTYVLRAKSKGKFTIGSAKVSCKSSENTSQEVSINVLDANEVHQANEGVATHYYKIETNKSSVFVGEPFVLTFNLYTQKMPEEITSIAPGNAVGLWRHQLYDETSRDHVFKTYQKQVKGQTYNVVELRKEVCFADQAGKLNISEYFGRAVEKYGIWENKYMEGYSNNLDMTVKELPVEKPADYFGMAGDFQLEHEISQKSIAANRALEMQVVFSGTGNFHLFQGPKFTFPKDSFLITEPEITEELTYTEDGVSGKITYDYVITPTKAGTYPIDAFGFSYFDWKDRQMKSVSIDSFALEVSKGKDPEIKNMSDMSSDQVVENDIRFIATKSDRFFKKGDLYFGRMWYWLILFFSPLVLFVFILIRKRRSSKTIEEITADEQKQTKRSAIREIQQLTKSSTGNELRQLKNTLETYFMTNLGLSRSTLSKQQIGKVLKEKEIAGDIVQNFESVWDRTEIAQYSPISESNANELYEESIQLIKQLNKSI